MRAFEVCRTCKSLLIFEGEYRRAYRCNRQIIKGVSYDGIFSTKENFKKRTLPDICPYQLEQIVMNEKGQYNEKSESM